jgi:feruloyl esterase
MKHHFKRLVMALAAATALAACVSPQTESAASASVQAGDCAGLVGMQLRAGGMVESATLANAGETWQPEGLPIPLTIPKAVCQIIVALQPVEGSRITAAVWLPGEAEWNGRFVASGSGGFAGSITEPQTSAYLALQHGYASAGTDSGHRANALDASWALNNAVAVEDWAHRANHVTSEAAKQLIEVFYGRRAERSYFNGCSNGGREALMQAARYPHDYDGIISGAPAMGFTEVMTSFAWNARAVQTPGGELSPENLTLLNNAVLARCDALDGVRDGVIEHPPSCSFDPAELRCTSRNRGACLTDAQIATVNAIRQGPRTSSGQQIWPGFELSSEPGWSGWIIGPTAGHRVFAENFFRYMVHSDPEWTLDRFDLDRDYARANASVGALIDSDNPDLSAFFRSGGKLLMYTGWLDPAISPRSTIDHYEAIRQRVGAAHEDDIRLFVAPGMNHCVGGPGPSSFDSLAAIDQWVDTGEAPEQIVAARHANFLAGILGRPETIVSTRPLCAWPQRAVYRGEGSTDDAANFSCAAPD